MAGMGRDRAKSKIFVRGKVGLRETAVLRAPYFHVILPSLPGLKGSESP